MRRHGEYINMIISSNYFPHQWVYSHRSSYTQSANYDCGKVRVNKNFKATKTLYRMSADTNLPESGQLRVAKTFGDSQIRRRKGILIRSFF